MDDEEIKRWSELELIRNTLHDLRQYASTAHMWIQVLTSDQADAGDEQFKQMLLDLRRNIQNIVEIKRWMEVWSDARKDEERVQ